MFLSSFITLKSDLPYQITPLFATEPVKETIEDSIPRAVKNFKERFKVEGFTELDALEALHPGVMRSILEEELNRYYDWDLEQAKHRHKVKWDSHFKQVADQTMTEFEPEIHEIQSEYLGIQEQFQQQIDDIVEKAKRIWLAISVKLNQNMPAFPIEKVPEATIAEERDGALYDSSRDYLQQNDVYQAYKGKEAYAEEGIA